MVIMCRFLTVMAVVLVFGGLAEGHGRLLEPPSRSSMWRVKNGWVRQFPNAPVNYNDNQLFCGGRINYLLQHKQCGICGDPYQGPRHNEAGGRYATGTIGRHYTSGQTIDIAIQITANHFGFFEFRLCPNNDVHRAATQECLDQNLLHLENADGTRYYLGGRRGMIHLKARLPAGVTCSQCVLQWRWKTGNSYGYASNGTYCIGCGIQEMFLGCSDIAISGGSNGQAHAQNTPRPTQRPFRPVIYTQRPITQRPFVPVIYTQRPVYTPQPTTHAPTARPNNGGIFIGQQTGHQAVSRCQAINLWAGVKQLDQWCLDNCQMGNCPSTACRCF